MFSRVVKLNDKITFQDWIKANNYSILSPRHRGFYAEMIFQKICKKLQIMAIKINPNIEILDQIPLNFLKKIQQKELKKMGKVRVNFFCVEKERGFFVILKMGTSAINSSQRVQIQEIYKNNIYLCRVFEDSDVFIKKIN